MMVTSFTYKLLGDQIHIAELNKTVDRIVFQLTNPNLWIKPQRNGAMVMFKDNLSRFDDEYSADITIRGTDLLVTGIGVFRDQSRSFDYIKGVESIRFNSSGLGRRFKNITLSFSDGRVKKPTSGVAGVNPWKFSDLIVLKNMIISSRGMFHNISDSSFSIAESYGWGWII